MLVDGANCSRRDNLSLSFRVIVLISLSSELLQIVLVDVFIDG